MLDKDLESLKDQINEELYGVIQPDSPLAPLYKYHLDLGGKRFRGILALLETSHRGVSLSWGLNWALACEWLHNATLIHDDIQDNDPLRRGKTSLWKKFGLPSAINVADQMIMKSFGWIGDCGPQSPHLVQYFSQKSQELVEGQAVEFDLMEQKCRDFWSEYKKVAYLKTGALLQTSVQGVHNLM